MKSRKYKVCRDNVYVGQLGSTDGIYENSFYSNWFPQRLIVNNWKALRSILFTVEDGLANDLLYNSPNYPILNISDDDSILNSENIDMIIQNVNNISLLLEYFKYSKNLTIDDIIKIRKTFFTGRFAKDNCELFGYRELKPDKMRFFIDGKEVLNNDELEEERKKYRFKHGLNNRIFVPDGNELLPMEYFKIIDFYGDERCLDCGVSFVLKRDAFIPDREEGPIKKLKRF